MPVLSPGIRSIIMQKFRTDSLQVMEIMDMYGITVGDMPEAADYLEGRKVFMIRRLLRQLKDHDYAANISSTLELARSVGLDWPELDIIEKSFKKEYPMAYPDPDSIYESPIGQKEEGRKMVLDILDRVNKGHRGIYYVMYKMDYFNLNLKDWPEVRDWLDDKKNQLIKDLLVNMKEGRDGQSTADFTLTRMRKIGLVWPELNIIEKSLHSERPELRDKEVNESESAQTTTHKIILMMLRSMHEGKAFALEQAITRFENLDYGDREILRFLSKHDEDISDWVDDLLAANAGHNRPRQLDQVMNLIEIGATWPSLVAVLNKHKDVIVRHMLTQLSKAGQDTEWIIDNMDGWCKKLVKAGIKWPELDIIRRSVDKEQTRFASRDIFEQREDGKPLSRWMIDQIKERIDDYVLGIQGTMSLRKLATDLADYHLTPEETERFTRDAKKFIHADLERKLRNMVSIPINDMVALHKAGLFDDKMVAMLNGTRAMIVRGLLQTVKGDSVHRAYHAGVEPLKSLGIDWPELDAIEKSHASEYYRNRSLRDRQG